MIYYDEYKSIDLNIMDVKINEKICEDYLIILLPSTLSVLDQQAVYTLPKHFFYIFRSISLSIPYQRNLNVF